MHSELPHDSPRQKKKPTKLPGKARKKQMFRGSPEGRPGFCRLHPYSSVSWAHGQVLILMTVQLNPRLERGCVGIIRRCVCFPRNCECSSWHCPPRRGVTHFPGRLCMIPNTTPGWLFEISFGNRGRREILTSHDFCERKGVFCERSGVC